MKIGQLIKQRRKDLRYTQKQIADKAGVTIPTINDLEKDRNSRLGTVNAVLEALDGEMLIVWDEFKAIK